MRRIFGININLILSNVIYFITFLKVLINNEIVLIVVHWRFGIIVTIFK